MFDERIAVNRWRHQLSARGPWSEQQLDELEAHLLDAMEELSRTELSAEERFLVATHRLGHPALLASEYEKVTPWISWRRPVFWAAAGVAWCLGVEAILDSAIPLAAIVRQQFGLAIGWLGVWAFVVYVGGPLITFGSVAAWFRRHPPGHPASRRALLITTVVALTIKVVAIGLGPRLQSVAWRGLDVAAWRQLQWAWHSAVLAGLVVTASVAAWVLVRFRNRQLPISAD